jgi:tetratricopeptide (TPR) repeat protein
VLVVAGLAGIIISLPILRPVQSILVAHINSRTAQDFVEKGDAKYRKEDYKGAIADYGQAIRLKPDYAEAYNNRGVVRNLGDRQGAISDYNQAIKLKPDYAEAYHNRGFAYNALGDKQNAITDYDQAITLKPYYVEAYNNRGIVRNALGEQKPQLPTMTKRSHSSPIMLKPTTTEELLTML